MWMQIGEAVLPAVFAISGLDPVERVFEEQQDVVVTEEDLAQPVEIVITIRVGWQRLVHSMASIDDAGLSCLDDEVQRHLLARTRGEVAEVLVAHDETGRQDLEAAREPRHP